MSTLNKYAIIVAGGSGSRMKSEIPKQFLPLLGTPILFHTLKTFLQIPDIQLIVVLPKQEIDYFNQQLTLHQLSLASTQTLQITVGGTTRFQSVKNGLALIKEDGIVAVHDGVRPLVSLEIIQNSYFEAERLGSGVTSVVPKDSLRMIEENGNNRLLNRDKIRLMQTPQTFRLNIFRKAFESAEQPFFTDCASVVEFAGFPINLMEGSYENIKITTPEDLIIAEKLLQKQLHS